MSPSLYACSLSQSNEGLKGGFVVSEFFFRIVLAILSLLLVSKNTSVSVLTSWRGSFVDWLELLASSNSFGMHKDSFRLEIHQAHFIWCARNNFYL